MDTMLADELDVEKKDTDPALCGLGEGTPPRKRSRHLLLALVAVEAYRARAVAAMLFWCVFLLLICFFFKESDRMVCVNRV